MHTHSNWSTHYCTSVQAPFLKQKNQMDGGGNGNVFLTATVGSRLQNADVAVFPNNSDEEGSDLTHTHSIVSSSAILNRGAPSKPASSKRKVDARGVAEKGCMLFKSEIYIFFYQHLNVRFILRSANTMYIGSHLQNADMAVSPHNSNEEGSDLTHTRSIVSSSTTLNRGALSKPWPASSSIK